MQNGGFVIRLTAGEVLAFSDWLGWVQMAGLRRLVDGSAVRAPIHKIAGDLNSALPWIFASDYTERLDAARQRLRTPIGGEEVPHEH